MFNNMAYKYVIMEMQVLYIMDLPYPVGRATNVFFQIKMPPEPLAALPEVDQSQ